MTYAIVILNWNGLDFLRQYLPPLLDSVQGMDGVSVVVADNASGDGSVDMLRSEFPSVRVIQLDKNYGFAGGYNKALNQLQEDCFLLLNSDVDVPGDWFYPLKEWMEMHPECGICGPKLHQMEQRDLFEYAGAAGGYLDRFCYPFCRGRVMNRIQADEGQYDIPADVLWVSGAALMIRSSLFFSLGGFCDKFFAHMEEIDLCWRARLEGWKVSVVPRSVVYHLGGGSLPQNSPRKLFYNYRNNLLMMSRCLPKTIAAAMAFNLASSMVEEDEGPDMFSNCEEFFLDADATVKDAITHTCADFGRKKASSIIFFRMILDGFSAIVYLLQGHKDYYRAVVNAHKEFKHMREKVDIRELRDFVYDILSGEKDDAARVLLTDMPGDGNQFSRDFGVRGMWNEWIVWQSIRKKDSIFAEIKDTII